MCTAVFLIPQTATCEGDTCEVLPVAARGTLMGELNGEDLGIVSLTANVSALGMQRTITANISPLIPKHVWFGLVSYMYLHDII